MSQLLKLTQRQQSNYDGSLTEDGLCSFYVEYKMRKV